MCSFDDLNLTAYGWKMPQMMFKPLIAPLLAMQRGRERRRGCPLEMGSESLHVLLTCPHFTKVLFFIGIWRVNMPMMDIGHVVMRMG
jgi:hypothetical protein